jgi:hypothetical protein
MKGFGRHLAASIAITAVFVVCAVAISFAAGPATMTGSVEGKAAVTDVAVPINAVEEAPEEAPQVVAAPAVEDSQAVETVAEPLVAAPAQPDAVPEAAPQAPENPEPAAPKKPAPVLNPPKNLAGTFIPGKTGTFIPGKKPYVELTWDSNNSKKVVAYFKVYRLVVGETEQGNVAPIANTKKTAYDDQDIKPGLTYRYWVTAVAKSGEESGASNLVDIKTYDNTPPAAPQGLQAWAIDPGVSLDWESSKSKNLAGYNVYESKGSSHKWRKLNDEPVLDNHYYHRKGEAGRTYAVAAVNYYGVESEYVKVKAVASEATIFEENDPAISVEGLWVTETYEGPTNGKIRVAGESGDKIHFKFKGSQVKMIVARYWTCGNANIYVDGQLVETVNLYNYNTIFGVVEVDMPGLKRGEHVLTMEALGTGNPEGTHNFVNVDAFEVR